MIRPSTYIIKNSTTHPQLLNYCERDMIRPVKSRNVLCTGQEVLPWGGYGRVQNRALFHWWAYGHFPQEIFKLALKRYTYMIPKVQFIPPNKTKNKILQYGISIIIFIITDK